MDLLILEARWQIVCARRMLQQLPSGVSHVFCVIRRSATCLSIPFRTKAISDCLGRFFGISAILLERQIGWLTGGDSGDPIRQCLTVCCKCDNLLQKGIILIDCRGECGIFYVLRNKIMKVSLPWLAHFSRRRNNCMKVPLLLTHGKSYPLLCMFSKRSIPFLPVQQREAGYYTFTYTEDLDTPECTMVHIVWALCNQNYIQKNLNWLCVCTNWSSVDADETSDMICIGSVSAPTGQKLSIMIYHTPRGSAETTKWHEAWWP